MPDVLTQWTALILEGLDNAVRIGLIVLLFGGLLIMKFRRPAGDKGEPPRDAEPDPILSHLEAVTEQVEAFLYAEEGAFDQKVLDGHLSAIDRLLNQLGGGSYLRIGSPVAQFVDRAKDIAGRKGKGRNKPGDLAAELQRARAEVAARVTLAKELT